MENFLSKVKSYGWPTAVIEIGELVTYAQTPQVIVTTVVYFEAHDVVRMTWTIFQAHNIPTKRGDHAFVGLKKPVSQSPTNVSTMFE